MNGNNFYKASNIRRKQLLILLFIIFFIAVFLVCQYYVKIISGKNSSSKLSEEDIEAFLAECLNASPSEKQKCYINLGRSKNNLALCDKISDPASGLYGDDYWIAYCYGGVAAERKDGKICKKLRSENYDILDGCYFTAASILNNPDICSISPNESTKTLCFAGMAALEMNPDVCNKLKGDSKCLCYLNLLDMASDSSNKEIYEEISNRIEKENCFPK